MLMWRHTSAMLLAGIGCQQQACVSKQCLAVVGALGMLCFCPANGDKPWHLVEAAVWSIVAHECLCRTQMLGEQGIP